MDREENYYTLKGYSLMEAPKVTSSMEDYLEMIYRFHQEGQTIRINKLAACLHVKPSSASKMVGNLRDEGLVRFEKYGAVTLTERGITLGDYLLFRHKVLHRFFCYVNHSCDELEQVEKVEHFIDPKTVWNLKAFLDQLDGEKDSG